MKNTLQISQEDDVWYPQYFKHLKTVIVVKFNDQGYAIDGNAGFSHLLGIDLVELQGLQIKDKFINPSFDDFMSSNLGKQVSIYEGILTIGDYQQNNRSVAGVVQRIGINFMLVAEHDLEALELLNSTVISLNEELSRLQRDNLKVNRSLKQKEIETNDVLDQLIEMNIQLQSEVARRRGIEEKLKHYAMHDDLTSLPNHALLKEQADKMLSLAKRQGGQVALMFIDIDNFKEINDIHGHARGDVALVELSLLLQDIVRQSDIAGRWGGDEFIVLLPNYGTVNDLEGTANRILHQANQPLDSLSFDTLKLSIGISIYPDNALDHQKLITIADEAMYKAKKAGGNQYYLSNSKP